MIVDLVSSAKRRTILPRLLTSSEADEVNNRRPG